MGGVALDLIDRPAVLEAFGRIKGKVARAASEADFLGVTVQKMLRFNYQNSYEVLLGTTSDPQFGALTTRHSALVVNLC